MRAARESSIAASSGHGAARCTVSTKLQACATSCGALSTRGHEGTQTERSASFEVSPGTAAHNERTLQTLRSGGNAAADTAALTTSPSSPLTMKAGIGGGGEPNRPMRKAGRPGPSSSGRSLTTTAANAPASAQSQTAVAQSGAAGARWISERGRSTTEPAFPPRHSADPSSCSLREILALTESLNRGFQIAGTTPTSSVASASATNLGSSSRPGSPPPGLLVVSAFKMNFRRPVTGTFEAVTSKLPRTTRPSGSGPGSPVASSSRSSWKHSSHDGAPPSSGGCRGTASSSALMIAGTSLSPCTSTTATSFTEDCVFAVSLPPPCLSDGSASSGTSSKVLGGAPSAAASEQTALRADRELPVSVSSNSRAAVCWQARDDKRSRRGKPAHRPSTILVTPSGTDARRFSAAQACMANSTSSSMKMRRYPSEAIIHSPSRCVGAGRVGCSSGS
mmetsp:Transcript_7717/g.21069  ORF Transcript_7717/g.21069 Transcript_7717/m.21069 type:complete len:450 (-) Transcript_7717:1513-2862(-)